MMRKPKPIGELSKLPQEKKRVLLEWRDELGLVETAKKVEKEWGIKTNKDQVSRWYKRYKLEGHVDEASEDQLAVGMILDAEALGNVEYRPAAMKLVEKRAFELAVEGDTRPQDLKDVFGIFYRAEKAESDRQRVEVAKERNRIARENLELKKLKLPRKLRRLRSMKRNWKSSGRSTKRRSRPRNSLSPFTTTPCVDARSTTPGAKGKRTMVSRTIRKSRTFRS